MTGGSEASLLLKQRREAVQMRLAGASIAEVRERTGLSAPTIISAFKAFQSGGWSAIEARPAGRQLGARRVLSARQEIELLSRVLREPPPEGVLWTAERVGSAAQSMFGVVLQGRALARLLERAGLAFPTLADQAAVSPKISAWHREQVLPLLESTKRRVGEVLWCGEALVADGGARILVAQTMRGTLGWMPLAAPFRLDSWLDFLARLRGNWPAIRGVLWHGIAIDHPELQLAAAKAGVDLHPAAASPGASPSPGAAPPPSTTESPDAAVSTSVPVTRGKSHSMKTTHLQRLEAESIHIMREVVAEAERPVLLYTAGKDSATMLHIARKAFYPAPPPFPLLHIDTTWEFRDMYSMREQVARECGMRLIVHRNPEAMRLGINPFTHGSQIHADLWNTEGLRQALDEHRFDIAFGGARRDEEKSRAKERVFSFRTAQHRWDPKSQRPELWNLYNARKKADESIRVFPLSNWTELDIWQYILVENVPIVPLYLARERPVVERNGALIMVDDERMPLQPGEVPVMRKVRFRTLGCYPLTAAVASEAETLAEVIDEIFRARTSERQGRLIDHDGPASMERKKQEGYF